MIVDLTEFEESKRSFELTFGSEDFDIEGEPFGLKGDVKFEGEIVKQISQIDVIGSIAAKVENMCSRCLAKKELSITHKISAAFVSARDQADQKDTEVALAELDVSVAPDDRIDLKELAREEILLAVPAQFLCSEDCKGLCPVCGANKNLIDCKCSENEIDPRWSALKNLIK